MTDAVVVDTDVVSYGLKGDTRAELYQRHLQGRTLVMSFMTLAELYYWAERYRWGEARRADLEQRTRNYLIHGFSRLLCLEHAQVTTSAEAAGRPISCADAWIAATATHLGIPLVTHNGPHFEGVPGLTIICEPN